MRRWCQRFPSRYREVCVARGDHFVQGLGSRSWRHGCGLPPAGNINLRIATRGSDASTGLPSTRAGSLAELSLPAGCRRPAAPLPCRRRPSGRCQRHLLRVGRSPGRNVRAALRVPDHLRQERGHPRPAVGRPARPGVVRSRRRHLRYRLPLRPAARSAAQSRPDQRHARPVGGELHVEPAGEPDAAPVPTPTAVCTPSPTNSTSAPKPDRERRSRSACVPTR